MLFFIFLAGLLIFIYRKNIFIAVDKEEHISSREFWMFIGMLVLIIGSIQITFTTSIPVINKILNTKLAPPADPIDHYNRWQIPVAIIICLLIGLGQFFKYKQSATKDVFRKISTSIIISILITGLSAILLGEYKIHYYILLFTSVFCVTANLDYLTRIVKGKWNHAGASIAHAGIGLILLGALISNTKKDTISQNVKGINLGKDFPAGENIMIEQARDTLPMGEYFVTYKGREQKGVNLYYTIEYFKQDEHTGNKAKAFELTPILQLNDRMGNVAEPATKHFVTKDIYTHLTYADIEDLKSDTSDLYQPPKTHSLAITDTFATSNSFVILKSLDKDINKDSLKLSANDIAVAAVLEIEDINKNRYECKPVFVIHEYEAYSTESLFDTLGLKFVFSKIHPETGKIDITVSEKKSNKRDFIIMKAIIFPGINILWIGCILLILGSSLAVKHRINSLRKKAEV
jgi:cytochrome c-type biogenesis protein CcmF